MSETTENVQQIVHPPVVTAPHADAVVKSPTAKSMEDAQARSVAQRYRLEFIDLETAEVDYRTIHELPVDLMVRYNFVPLSRDGNTLQIVIADPTNLDAIDEIEAQLRVRVKIAVGARSAIEEALKRGDTAARILQDATAEFRTDRLSLVRETEHGEEDLDLDRLAGDEEISPIIKLVDTVVLNAL